MIINIFQLKEQLEDGTIKVVMGTAFADYTPKQMIQHLVRSFQDRFGETYPHSLPPDLPVEEVDRQVLLLEDKRLPGYLRIGIGEHGASELKAHSFILGHTFDAFLNDKNEIHFFRLIYPDIESQKRPDDSPGAAFGRSLRESIEQAYYIKDEVDPEILKAIKGKVKIPSKKVVFANHFGHGLPHNEHEERFSLNSMIGRYNLAKELNEHGYGYGQTGNCHFTVLTNDTEIILFAGYVEDLEFAEENYGCPLGLPFFKWLRENKFKKSSGNIHMSVWRWECADYELVKDKLESLEEYFVLDIPTETLSYEHYWRTLSDFKGEVENRQPYQHPDVIARFTFG